MNYVVKNVIISKICITSTLYYLNNMQITFQMSFTVFVVILHCTGIRRKSSCNIVMEHYV